jgi:large subunit ribosomal protein L25
MTTSATSPSLTATHRTEIGRANALRRSGKVPAVVYGNTKETIALSVDAIIFNKLYHEVGTSTLVDLTIDEAKPIKVLIHDVDVDPIYRKAQHIDFYAVNLKEKLRTEVPLVFTGVAPAVDILGGTLLTVQDTVEIECLPEDLVHEIVIDITALKTFDDTVSIADLVVPAGITIHDDPEQTLVSVTQPRSEEELASLEDAPSEEVTTEFETKDGVAEAPTDEPAA